MNESNASSRNSRVVLADGCFDPLHIGHVRYLEAAGALDDTLIVQIAPDAAILAKGRAPFQTRQERADTVLALHCVDDVVAFDTLEGAIRIVRPRILVKGSDWRGRLPSPVIAACHAFECEVVYVDTQARTSTERLA